MEAHHPIGIYLAAGNSRRFGNDKLKQPIKGKALGTIALETALNSDLKQVIVVTKEAHIPWLNPFLSHKKCRHITCPQALYGQSLSIQCGLRYAEKQMADAVMILLADQPFITHDMINTLINTYRKNKNAAFVASCHKKTICPPILFSKHLFPNLYTLTGDVGAKYLLAEKAAEGMFLDFECKQAFQDVDTMMDYERIIRADSS